jgi:L-ascorbate metabolism protein UlaG (beta-lactamase superfamily)
MTQIRFFGVAAYEIVTGRGQHILIDPFLDENPGSPVRSHELERVDLVLVSHAAFDHLGDAEAIARRTGAPVVCGGEIKAYLTAKGIPADQIRATTWGIAVEVAGIRVQPVECHHWSQIRMPDGTYASGVPMGFVVEAGPDVRFYHYGDSALFSDLRLIGELYQPTIGCLGITQPVEIVDRVCGPGRLLTGEMSPREAALAAQWLGLETVLPCHYINPDCDEMREFHRHLDAARARRERVPQSVVLDPGEVYVMDQQND